MPTQTVTTSPKVYARAAGTFYLINILFGFFAIGYVPSVIIVSGNATATAQHMLAHEELYRLGFASHVVVVLTNIPLAVLFYKLFNVVNQRVALLIVFFTLTGTAIESVNLLNEFAPLLIVKGGAYLNSFTPQQLESLGYIYLRIQTIGLDIALVFFGCYGISVGWLIIKSSFIPPVVGAFMMLGGICYVFNSFAVFIIPKFAASLVPYIQAPSGLSELVFCLWLLIAGVNEARWNEKSNSYTKSDVAV